MTMLARGRNRGFVVGYLLFAVGVLAFIVAATGSMMGRHDNAKWIAQSKDKIEDQANLIMTQLMICAMLNTVESETEASASYPEGMGTLVSSLVCPGTSATVWDGSAGTFMPPVVSGFSDWRYFKQASGSSATIYFYATAADAVGATVLKRVGERLGTSQTAMSQTIIPNDTLKVFVISPD